MLGFRRSYSYLCCANQRLNAHFAITDSNFDLFAFRRVQFCHADEPGIHCDVTLAGRADARPSCGGSVARR